ncbi:unnamed protein product, partial [Ectocarpus sp. 12 AP-2014]
RAFARFWHLATGILFDVKTNNNNIRRCAVPWIPSLVSSWYLGRKRTYHGCRVDQYNASTPGALGIPSAGDAASRRAGHPLQLHARIFRWLDLRVADYFDGEERRLVVVVYLLEVDLHARRGTERWGFSSLPVSWPL